MGILEDTLQAYVGGWQQNCARWPLWTYNRAPYQATASFDVDGTYLDGTTTPVSWRLYPHWAERLRWSPLLPYVSLVSGLSRAGEESSFRPTRFPEPGESTIPGVVPGRSGLAMAKLSVRFRVRATAIFASLAREIPSRLEEFAPPSDYCRRGWLDAGDRDEIAERAQKILFEFRPDGDQVPTGSGVRPPAPLFLYFLELSSRMLKTESEGVEQLRRQGDTLTRLFTRAVGLLPGDLSGGARSTLPVQFREGLLSEAEEIVRAVWDYTPSPGSAQAWLLVLKQDGGRNALAVERARPHSTWSRSPSRSGSRPLF